MKGDIGMNELTALTFGLQAFVTLLVILDPPGAAPLFLTLTGSKIRQQQVKMAWLAAATSLLIISIITLIVMLAAATSLAILFALVAAHTGHIS